MTPRAALTTLGLAPLPLSEISHARVKKAYIAQTLRCHPDLHPDDPDATEKFRRLSDALRVALKSLESNFSAGAAAGRVALDDSQSVLEALRQAMAAYHACRDNAARFCRGGGGGGKNNNHDDTSRDEGERSDSFLFHSLEYVSSVCQTEALAMRQVRQFCDELPEVLCGRSCVLFEVVAFFNMRYVEAMSRCVLRFSKNLPIIVNRVVKGRKKHVRYVHKKANSGFGTGCRPRTQRIEDMAMKPLVLVGALLFDHGPEPRTGAGDSQGRADSEATSDTQGDIRSTCGAVSLSEIKICEELRCVIYLSDSIGDITEKIGKWEAASYERLQLELAMVDTTSLLSGMLGLNEHSLAVMHHLHLPKEVSEKVSLTLQKLTCGLCYHCDEKPLRDGGVWENGGHEDQVSELRISDGIHRCRHLASVTAGYIEGNVTLRWDEQTPLVESTEEVAVGDEEDGLWKHAEEAQNRENMDIMVLRHMSCCTAETIRFSISVKLSKDIGVFLSRLVTAMESVLEQAEISTSLLPQILEVREKVVNSEFIPQETNSSKDDVAPLTGTEEKEEERNSAETSGKPTEIKTGELITEGSGPCGLGVLSEDGLRENEEKEEDIKYQYRGPIHCFPRIFSMSTALELSYWQMVHEHRVYLAQHAPSMNPINVYYNCLPYKPHPHTMHHNETSPNEEVFGGWVGEAEDGTDNVVITSRELEGGSAFRGWLEDVVEQSSLNKECHRIVNEAGVGYLTRDPALPLPQYLSFVKVFCAAAGVRGVLEHRATKTRTVTPEDIGLVIVVGTECDVRDGGRLLVPWWMDPSLLLALLQDDTIRGPTLIDDGSTVSRKD